METEIIWPAWIISGALTPLFFWLALRAGRRLRFLSDTPTSKAKGVFIGQVELTGRAQLDPPCRSFLAEIDCVWFNYTIEEEWSRWETETYTDQDGKTKTRQVLKSGWTQIANGGQAPAFYSEDETGAVLVQPEGAEIEAPTVFSEAVSRSHVLYFEKATRTEIANTTGQRRFHERALPLKTELFISGHARERADVVAPEIASDPAQELFLISYKSETSVQSRYRWQFWLFGLLMAIGLPVASLIQFYATEQPFDLRIILGLGAILLAGWFGGWLWMAFNSLVRLRNRSAQGWSLIDVQLKRRAELIPRLVEVVKGLRDHERTVQSELAALRTQAVATAPGQPGPDIDSARPILLAITESYPELKSSDAFLRLQRELSDTETRVALARDYYNTIATHLNTRLKIVPDRWFAPLAGLRPQALLTVESFERSPAQVNLGSS